MEPKIKRNFTFQVSEKGGSEWNHTNAGDIYDAYPTEDEIVEYYKTGYLEIQTTPAHVEKVHGTLFMTTEITVEIPHE